MNTAFLPDRTYRFLFFLLTLVYIIGLFVPLMDNDSAHHATIALRMYLTGDYVNLIDNNMDYLDKPHLLFWLSAMSFKAFGVTAFAYRLPSFLLTIFGTYCTYRLGAALHNREVGKLSALVIASAFAYVLANNDVRMDAMLTAFIAFATWQIIEVIQNKKLMNVAGAALGLALGFSTKGHVAVFVPAMTGLFYIVYRKEWQLFFNWRWLVLLVLFVIFISPVIYCYYLQYNLHPEKVVRGRDHIDGVKFILFNQSLERFSGEMGSDSKNDYLFFFHSFLWAFAPWSLLAYAAIVVRIRKFFRKEPGDATAQNEWATAAVFFSLALVVSLSRFKLPHYVNVAFPAAAVLTAAFVLRSQKAARRMYVTQVVVSALILLLTAFINAWAFPVRHSLIVIAVIALLAVVFYFVRSSAYTMAQKTVTIPVAVMSLLFLLLNANFYPQLLEYQAGQALAAKTRGKVDPKNVYTQPDSYSASYAFSTVSLPQRFNDSTLRSHKNVWLLTEPEPLEHFKAEGYQTGAVWAATHFRITKMSFGFLNPSTRLEACSSMMLVQVTGKTSPR